MPPLETTSPVPADCSVCGSQLAPDGECHKCADRTVARIIRRDLGLLTILAVAAVLLFLGTRYFANAEGAANRRQAENWYREGLTFQQNSDAPEALAAFRKAVAGDPHDLRYSLALAKALEHSNRDDEARQLLLGLRESEPEDAEINLEVARVAAKRKDVDEASHYYRHALFGYWSQDDAGKRRIQTEFELVRFELAQHRREAALSDALMLEAALPSDDLASRIAVGELYLQMDEPLRALHAFEVVLHSDRNNGQALLGAAKANFSLGRFSEANRYLKASLSHSSATDESKRVGDLLPLIFNADPNARNLSRAERSQRTRAIVSQALTRVQSCIQTLPSTGSSRDQLTAAEGNLLAIQSRLKPAEIAQDDIADALSAVYKAETAAATACGNGDNTDQALLALAKSAVSKER